MLLKSNIDDLRKFLKNENLLINEEERYCYAQDSANIRDNFELPDVVVFVETTEDVQNIVKYANMHKIPVICRGAGTNTVGSCTCPNGGIVLNFSKMNKIIAFSPENMTMRVQPGVILGDIKKLAESEKLFYPPDPSNFKVSTIGGSIAQSSGGAKSFKYGTTKDYILSLTVVLADGTIVKLGSGMIKDAVGYHLNQLIIGSEGTLAIVVEAELKLIPLPESSAVVSAYFESIETAISGVNGIIKERIFPATIDFMDKNSINTVEKFYPCSLITDASYMLLIEADGSINSTKEQTEKIQNILSNSGASHVYSIFDEDEKEKIWTARRSSFASAAKLGFDVVSDDIIVPKSALKDMIQGCNDICKKHNLNLCLVGHIGDGNIHPQIALNLEKEEEFKSYTYAKSEMYELAIKLGGTISSEHGIGTEKLSYVDKTVDSNSLEMMKRIKTLFDPNNILNPEKIFKL